jgi:hypothetical protein
MRIAHCALFLIDVVGVSAWSWSGLWDDTTTGVETISSWVANETEIAYDTVASSDTTQQVTNDLASVGKKMRHLYENLNPIGQKKVDVYDSRVQRCLVANGIVSNVTEVVVPPLDRLRCPDHSFFISESCRDKILAAAGLSGIGLVVLFPLLLDSIGFIAEGVEEESIAAKWQSSIGDDSAGSPFALLQSIAMSGFTSSSVARLLPGAVLVSGSSATIVGVVCGKNAAAVPLDSDPQVDSYITIYQ